MDAILAGISDVVSVMGTVMSVITGNAYLVFLLSVSVVGVVIGLFVKAKNAARG